jgi:hypothetical protein
MSRLLSLCAVAAWLSGCSVCNDFVESRTGDSPTGLALDGALVVVGSEHSDTETADRAQISWVNLDDSSVTTQDISRLRAPQDISRLRAPQLAAGARTVLALGTTTFPSEELRPRELGAVLYQGGTPLGDYVRLSTQAFRARAQFDGTAYQIAWLEPKGDGFVVRGRSIDEGGTLSAVVTFGVPLGAAAGDLQVRPFAPGRVVMTEVEYEGSGLVHAARVHVWFVTAGVVDSSIITIDVPVAAEPNCAGGNATWVIGAETLADAAGAPLFRVFMCGSAANTVAVAEIVPSGVVRTASISPIGQILGAASDRVIIGDQTGVFEMLGDYSISSNMFAGYAGGFPHWIKRNDDWVSATLVAVDDLHGAMVVQRFTPAGGEVRTTVTVGEGQHSYEECHGTY